MATIRELHLQRRIENFVRDHAPRDKTARALFIDQLRELMNAYADAAIAHGARPEAGTPHGSGRLT